MRNPGKRALRHLARGLTALATLSAPFVNASSDPQTPLPVPSAEASSSSSAIPAGTRVFLVDKASSSILSVEATSGTILAKAPVPALPDSLLETPDRSRLLLLERGRGQRTSCCGFAPEGKSAATILDAASLKTVARLELGWGLNVEDTRLSPDGRHAVLFCPGYRSQVPSEERPQEIVVVDAADAALVGRLPLDRRSDTFVTTPDGKTGLVFYRRNQVEDRPPQVVVVDLARVEVSYRSELAGEPSALLLTPHGQYALFYTKGHPAAERSGSPALMQILALASGTLSEPLRLDILPTDIVYGSDDTRAVFFAPRQEQRKNQVTPAALQVLDVPGGRLMAPVTLDSAPGKPTLSPDGKRLVVFAPRQEVEKQPPLSASLRTVDMSSGALGPDMVLDGAPEAPQPSPDGGLMYLLDRTLGRLHVLAADGQSLVSLDVGLDPRVFEDGVGKQIWVLSSSKNVHGELRLVRGATVVATIDVPQNPYLAASPPGQERLYVVGRGAMAAVDTKTMRVLGEVQVGDVKESLVRRLEFSVDGKRAVASFADGNRLSVFDTTTPRLVGNPKIGGKGARITKGVLSGIVKSVYYMSHPRQVLANPRVDFVLAADPLLVISADGLHAYALNHNTNDVSVVSTQTGEVIRTIAFTGIEFGATGGNLRLLGGGATVAMIGPNALTLIDTKSNAVNARVTFHGTRVVRLIESPDARHLLAFGGEDLYCLDTASGDVLSHIGGLKLGRALAEGAQVPSEREE